jgi:hypothetical protein
VKSLEQFISASQLADFGNPSTPKFQSPPLAAGRRIAGSVNELSVLNSSTDNQAVTDVEQVQLFSLRGIVADHRFLHS